MKKYKLSQLGIRKERILNKMKTENISDSEVIKLLKKRDKEYTAYELKEITKYIFTEKQEEVIKKKENPLLVYQTKKNKEKLAQIKNTLDEWLLESNKELATDEIIRILNNSTDYKVHNELLLSLAETFSLSEDLILKMFSEEEYKKTRSELRDEGVIGM